MQKQLKVTINGKHYSIATDENDTDVQQAAQLVDNLLKQNIEKLPIGAAESATLLVALQLATDLTKNNRLLSGYETRVEQLVDLLSK